MNLDRMQALIRATEEAKDEDFDMIEYAHFCGAPACLLGNYAARVDLQDTFELRKRHFGGFVVALKVAEGDGGLAESDTAVQDHFGISHTEAKAMFSSHGCDNAGTDKQAALAYLRAFVAGRSKP